jgi:hypothetical protein
MTSTATEEHGIPEEDYPAAFALWIAEKTGGPVPQFEKVVRREPPADGVVIEGDDLVGTAGGAGTPGYAYCGGFSIWPFPACLEGPAASVDSVAPPPRGTEN